MIRFKCNQELFELLSKDFDQEKIGFGKTYLLLDSEKLEQSCFVIMAYFTIAQKAVDISTISQKQRRKMLGAYPGRDHLQSIPAYLIGQLGRSDTYSAEQLSGKDILDECYHAISIAAKIVGGNLIVLECREGMFTNFYEKHGFKKLYAELSSENLYTLYKKVDFNEYWSKM